jgi:hypothetical protein
MPRYGNDYLVLLGKETSYGTEQTTYTSTLPDKIEIKESTAQIAVNQKTGSLEPQKNEIQAGYKMVSVTLSGELGIDSGITAHGILFAGFFSDDTEPFTVQAIGSTLQSYTMYQYFSDGNYNHVVGCVMESLNVTGASGETIKYSATFRGKLLTREDSGTPPSTPTQPEIQPLLFCSTVFSKIAGATNITKANSFNLTMNNTFADDKSIYQNSCTKSAEYKTGFNGTYTIEWNYDATNDSDVYDNILSTTLIEDNVDLFQGAAYFEIDTFGKITDYTLADPDKGIFVSSYTKQLMGDSSNSAVEIDYNAS